MRLVACDYYGTGVCKKWGVTVADVFNDTTLDTRNDSHRVACLHLQQFVQRLPRNERHGHTPQHRRHHHLLRPGTHHRNDPTMTLADGPAASEQRSRRPWHT
jgi:hypothetical protein